MRMFSVSPTNTMQTPLVEGALYFCAHVLHNMIPSDPRITQNRIEAAILFRSLDLFNETVLSVCIEKEKIKYMPMIPANAYTRSPPKAAISCYLFCGYIPIYITTAPPPLTVV